MTPCDCQRRHERKRIVLTGGPGAGKTAVLELVRQSLCRHVVVLPETAGILFSGGFPRGHSPATKKPAQRAILLVQRELEAAADAADGAAIVLCDRGTVDGSAYWPGPEDFWSSVGTTAAAELARYDIVIHLRTPPAESYNHVNPLRTETATEAALIDERIARAWDDHPRRFFVASTKDFLTKAHAAVSLLQAELPPCCPRT